MDKKKISRISILSLGLVVCSFSYLQVFSTLYQSGLPTNYQCIVVAACFCIVILLKVLIMGNVIPESDLVKRINIAVHCLVLALLIYLIDSKEDIGVAIVIYGFGSIILESIPHLWRQLL